MVYTYYSYMHTVTCYSPTETFTRDVLELSLPEFVVGVENTSIGWRYSSLSCQPAGFTIEGYATREDIPTGTPTLTLHAPSSPLTFPSNTTHQTQYWRLLASDCASDSAIKYYQLDNGE